MNDTLLSPPVAGSVAATTACGYPRDFQGNRLVYTVISPRAGGLSVGVNMNPDCRCNFDCAYCEVDHSQSGPPGCADPGLVATELQRTLEEVQSGRIRELAHYRNLPANLLKLRHVALSGDGEPTLCPNFQEIVESVVHVRARSAHSFFKLVLVTNATGLDRPEVKTTLGLFTARDEIWAKLEAGTEAYFQSVNRADRPLEKIISNILELGRERPVIIQSLFPALAGQGPSAAEIDAYVERLKYLKTAGARIPLVQIYSASRPTARPGCGHLPLHVLSHIAQRVRETGLRAEVF